MVIMGNLERKEREIQVRKNDIMSAAEKVFLEKGYEASTMDEIAAVAEYTKKTVYQYFQAKEDIYFALALGYFEELVQQFEGISAEPLPGLEKLMKAGDIYLQYFLEKPDRFLIIARARNIHVREAESSYHQEILKCQQRMFTVFNKAFTEGKADGSIKYDLDEKMSVLYMFSAIVSLFNEMAEVRNDFEAFFSVNLKEFMLFSMDKITLFFKAK